MNTAVLDQKETYREVNTVTGSVNSVIFGTEILAELPVSELVQDFGLNISVCNRSVEEAVLADAFDLLDECVYALCPRKVFLNFGETDLRRKDFDPEAFISDCRSLIPYPNKPRIPFSGACNLFSVYGSCIVMIIQTRFEELCKISKINVFICTA